MPPVASETGTELHLLEPDDLEEEELAGNLNGILIAWYLLIARVVCIIALVLLLAVAVSAQAVMLNTTTHVTGSGLVSANYTGDWLGVSIWQNASGLDILVEGGA
jgi:hypothetical protein